MNEIIDVYGKCEIDIVYFNEYWVFIGEELIVCECEFVCLVK